MSRLTEELAGKREGRKPRLLVTGGTGSFGATTDNVMRAAEANGVKSVVCLSTDKVAQAYARNNSGSGTTVSVTRYGNVMYFRGSVIPLLVELIRHGKPLTVTDPGMTRFLMSLEGRSLDYSLYTDRGEAGLDRGSDYNSDNTTQLSVEQVMDIVGALPDMQRAIADFRR